MTYNPAVQLIPSTASNVQAIVPLGTPVSFHEKQDFGNRLDQTSLLKAGQSVFVGFSVFQNLKKKKCYLKSNAVQLPMIFPIHI